MAANSTDATWDKCLSEIITLLDAVHTDGPTQQEVAAAAMDVKLEKIEQVYKAISSINTNKIYNAVRNTTDKKGFGSRTKKLPDGQWCAEKTCQDDHVKYPCMKSHLSKTASNALFKDKTKLADIEKLRKIDCAKPANGDAP